jgi:hypothetical protein
MFFIVKNHWDPYFTDHPRSCVRWYYLLLIVIAQQDASHFPKDHYTHIILNVE